MKAKPIPTTKIIGIATMCLLASHATGVQPEAGLPGPAVQTQVGLPGPAVQTDAGLPETARLVLGARFFMDEALELLLNHRSQVLVREHLERSVEEILYMGSQIRDDEVTDGYVSRSPETFVSITLFFDRAATSLVTVHVVMSPGMWSRALGFIDDAITSETMDVGGGSRTHLLGVESIGGRRVRVFLTERPSELGTIYALNYMLEPSN